MNSMEDFQKKLNKEIDQQAENLQVKVNTSISALDKKTDEKLDAQWEKYVGERPAENLYSGHDFAYFDKKLNTLGFGIKTETLYDKNKKVRFMKQFLFSTGNPKIALYEVKMPVDKNGNISIEKLDEEFFHKLLDQNETFTLRQDEGNNKKIGRYFYLDEKDSNELKLGPKPEGKS